jgi:O-phosphoseryl-tRNA(Cys) synthetase
MFQFLFLFMCFASTTVSSFDANQEMATLGFYSRAKLISTNFRAVVFNDSLGISRYNASAFIYKDLLGVKAMLIVKIKKPSAHSYDREIIKTTVDVCRLQNGVIGNFVAKVFYESFRDYSNYQFECPVKKNDYYLRNFHIPISIFPPSFYAVIIQGETFFNFILNVKARVAKVKGLTHLWGVNLYGSFVSHD